MCTYAHQKTRHRNLTCTEHHMKTERRLRQLAKQDSEYPKRYNDYTDNSQIDITHVQTLSSAQCNMSVACKIKTSNRDKERVVTKSVLPGHKGKRSCYLRPYFNCIGPVTGIATAARTTVMHWSRGISPPPAITHMPALMFQPLSSSSAKCLLSVSTDGEALARVEEPAEEKARLTTSFTCLGLSIM